MHLFYVISPPLHSSTGNPRVSALLVPLKPPKIPRKVVSTLSDEEIRVIINTLNPAVSSEARNQTIFMLLLDIGMRIGEMVHLRMGDIHMDEGFIKVMGKERRERILPLGSNAQRALQRYLFCFRSQPVHPGEDNVFLSRQGIPLTENSIKKFGNLY